MNKWFKDRPPSAEAVFNTEDWGPCIDTYHASNVTTLSVTDCQQVQVGNSIIANPDVFAST